MVSFHRVLYAEVRKAVRSPVLWTTGLVTLIFPLIGAGFMLIVRDPEGAKALGILGAKARLSGLTADWPSYLAFLNQTLVAGFLFLEAMLVAWLFGREWSDKTLKLLLAVPAGRGTVVAAKFAVVVLWAVAALGLFGIAGWLVGTALPLPPPPPETLGPWAGHFAAAGLLTMVLGTGTAFFASLGRGYLAPLAWALATLVTAQLGAALGWAAWTPWAVPALAAGVAGTEGPEWASLALVVFTSAAGALATVLFWVRADHSSR